MNVLFADDHDLVRDGIKPFIEELGSDVRVIDAVDFDTAMASGRACESLDLILLDLDMPGMNGLEGVKRFVEEFTDIPVVILSGHFHRDDVTQAMQEGVSGYIPKTIGGAALVNALRLVLAGERYLPSSLIGEDKAWTSRIKAVGNRMGIAEGQERLKDLSKREREILSHLVEGKTNKEIARELDLMEITVKIHVRNIYRKIGASNRAMAVRIALESGWTSG